MINVDAQLPDEVFAALPGQESILAHKVPVDAARWGKAIAHRGLPPLQGKLDRPGTTTLSREEVFTLGTAEINPESAFQLLYHSLAWGLGTRARFLNGRLDGLAADQDRAGALLTDAWTAARSGTRAADVYSMLTTRRGAGRIRNLGPAFSTKFLYFAQGASTEPRYLILDAVVSGNLTEAWPGAATGGWYPDTYGRYCTLLGNWARQASVRLQDSRQVRADEIELAIFKLR